jgi:hypothetical protein
MSIRVEDLRPEDDPRYLPPPVEFVPKGDQPAHLEERIAINGAILSTFASEGWVHIKGVLERRKESHINALCSVTGAHDLDAIFGLRQGLYLINQLIDLEDTARAELKRDSENLHRIRNREEKK